MTTRTITFDDEQWQVVPREPNEAMVRAGLEASLTANKYLAMLDAAPEPPASMLTQRKLTRAINALGIDSRAGTPDYVLSDAIWAYLHGIPAKSLPAQPRRPYGTDTMSEYGVIPECDGPKPPAQQPMSRDREIWRAALTLANNICVQESDRYNGDDATQEAAAASYCAQRIRDWIAPTDEQFAELLEEAGIGKGESNA